MSEFFQFESDFVESLRCIPMQVRYKLDTCGVKLKLAHWHQFPESVRQDLVDRPCQNAGEIDAYRHELQQQVLQYNDRPAKDLDVDPNPPWLNPAEVPEAVGEKAREFNVNLTVKQWQTLTPLQRFALIKLSRSGHENRNFLPALREFGLANSVQD
ncbi:nitrate reductase associated protein [Oxynema aestuarii]|jgi:hypothetical protein|uniref:Nitrate reductase maturation protein NarM n=1 Tax=Oxynema aestuarii AP17 TaxID=2064643 RepID=A0A6H1TZV4_9CYAN|nr:nitrate reductase associated protein [Oxynema aestuarii]QIZ72142.1 nitrate reductase maturation protein NarM [Oxynema aestuarii AP17]RMH74446.1 MAG: nitrate reductase associated protein [Cyanobacteria bacterium J007]